MTKIALIIKYFDDKDILYSNEETRKKFIKSLLKTINFDDATKGNKNVHNPNLPQISDHAYRILIIGGS